MKDNVDPQLINDSIKSIKNFHLLKLLTLKIKRKLHPFNILKKIIGFYNNFPNNDSILQSNLCHLITANTILLNNLPNNYKIRLIGNPEEIFHSYIVDNNNKVFRDKDIDKRNKWPSKYKDLNTIWEISIKDFKKISKRF